MTDIKKIFAGSFSLRLSLVMLGLVSILFALSFLGNSRTARKYVQNESIERAESALENTILRINNVLSSVELTIHNMSWLVAANLDNPESLYDITEHILQSNDFISGSAIAFEPYYYDEYGYFFSPYSYREGDSIKSIQLGTNEYNYHFMDWYQIPRLLNHPYWSEPYYDKGGGNMIMTTYSYPIYDQNGILTAIFTADLSLEWFTEQVNSIKPYPNAYNMMIGRGGTYLVHRNKENILNETMFMSARRTDDEPLYETARNMVDGKQGMMEFNRDDTRFYLFYAPVTATGWSVAVACLHSDIFAGVDTVRRYSHIAGIIGLLLMTVICFIVIHRMSKPLIDIANAAIDIAQGNLSTSLPEVTTHDEVRTLYDSFTNMQQSLLQYIDELQETTANKERIESELRIAREIQLGMVPKDFPAYPEREDIDLSACLRPAREVGGDLYDYFIDNDQLYFIIGDVSGKGVPASLVMAVTCRLFRTISSYIKTPEGIMSTINDALSESNESNMFCTALIGILDLKSGNLKYCNAGHNPPYLITPDGDTHLLKMEQNIALGIWSGFEYIGESCKIQRGSLLFMYTDGVTEAEDVNKSLYGEERLKHLLQKQVLHSTDTIVGNVIEDVEAYAEDAPQSDDITILCWRLNDSSVDNGCRTVVLKNCIDEIGRMTSFVEDISQEWNLSMENTFSINLALEEAVTNVIMYAYPKEEEHELTLEAERVDNRLVFRLIDTGKEFDPTLRPDPDLNLPLEERPIGGLGIFLIRNVMQTVEYTREDDRNILTMIKIIDK